MILVQQKFDFHAMICYNTKAEFASQSLIIEIPPTDAVDKIVGKIKSYTSKVLREEFPSLKSHLSSLWTRSKFVSSCGGVTLQVIKDYIESQSGQ